MKHSLLVTRPNFDLTTRYISAWAEKIIELAKNNGDKVFDLYQKRANRQELESMIQKHNPSLVFLNGHGDYDLILGQDNEKLICAGENEKLLCSRIVYALSCRSGKILGLNAVQSGAEGFIGYDEDFIFLYDENKRTRPMQDKIAEMFLEPSNQVVVSLLKNHTAQESSDNSKKSFVHKIRKFLSSQSTSMESVAVRYLIWDMQHQVCCKK